PRVRRAARWERGPAGGVPRRPRRGTGRRVRADAAAQRRRPGLRAGPGELAAGPGRRPRAGGGQRGHPAPVARGGLDGGGRAARCRPGRAVAAGGAGALRTGRGERRGGTVMSGRIRLTLAAWGATLLAASALLPLVRPATWLMQAAFLLAVQ